MENLQTALENLKDSLEQRLDSKTKSMQDQLDQLQAGAKKNKLKFGANSSEMEIQKSISDNEANFKAFAENKTPFRMKAATTIGTGNFGSGVVIGAREQGVNEAPFRRRRLLDIITTTAGGAGSNPLTWIEWRPKDGAPDTVAENATKPQMDWTYQEGKANAEVIAVTAVVTKQALLNMTILSQQVNDELIQNLQDELEFQILKGSGTSPDLKGIEQYAKSFTGGDLAGTISDPNNFDVIRAAILQVRQGNAATTGYSRRTGFRASHILLNPADIAAMDTVKNANGDYLKPFWANGERISGVQIIESDFIDANDFLVGDFSKSLFNYVSPVELETDTVNDQFIKNQRTIRAEIYGAHRVKYHDSWAFVQGGFESAKMTLAGQS